VDHVYRRDEVCKEEGEDDEQVDDLVRVHQVVKSLACCGGLRLSPLNK